MFAKRALVALFAAFAAAQLPHAPVGDEPEGNPITRPLNEAVVAGEPFTIMWTPSDTTHTVSLLLLKGSSKNVIPVGEPIAISIPNSGSYSWIPPSEFGPGLSETTGYGIQLIDDVTGKYQYSTQFGITVPEDEEEEPKPTVTKDGYGKPEPTEEPEETEKPEPTEYPTKKPAPSTFISVTAEPSAAPSDYPTANSSLPLPSKSMTVPSSLLTATPTSTNSPTETPSEPEFTGAAAHVKASFGLAAGVAGLFFML